MAQTPYADDELDGWVSLEAATRNVVVLLRLRKSGMSGNELAAVSPGGLLGGEETAADPPGGVSSAAESELRSAISRASTAFQQGAQSTILASTRRNAGFGQREQSMASSPDERAEKKQDAEQDSDAAKCDEKQAQRDYVARRLADIAALVERRARGE